MLARLKQIMHSKNQARSVPTIGSRRIHPVLFCILAFFFSFLVLRSLFPMFMDVSGNDLLEMSKCPACYGVNMCPAVLGGEITLDPFYQYKVSLVLNARNVYFAKYQKKDVVLKKLGSDDDLKALDREILDRAGHVTERIHSAIRTVTKQHLHVQFIADRGGGNGGVTTHHLLHPNSTEVDGREGGKEVRGSSMLTCPSQRKLHYVEEKVLSNNGGQNRLTVLNNIMTLMLINTEPLVFQAFPAKEGWPFPTYIGACGRLVIEEFVGPSLGSYLSSSNFEQRARVAQQLLQMADKLTLGTKDFKIYVTDLSLDNIAVAKDGSLKIVDGENIVVVDTQKIAADKPQDYNVSYSSKSFGCDQTDTSCFSYSEEALCQHLVNDHNYFAVCRTFLNPHGYNLLAHPPRKFSTLYPDMPLLLEQCYDSDNRWEVVKRIQDILSDFLRH